MTPKSRIVPVVLGIILLSILGEFLLILRLNSGHFTYTLDDPYIHLALAERIHEGHYGINRGEPSAPASSIVWPFLLSPFASTPIFEYLPLLANVLAGLGTAAVYFKIVARYATPNAFHQRPWIVALLVILLALCTNLIGLVFTGMEHSIQVLLVSLVVLGLLREAETGEVRPWAVLALAVGPLVRYESLAISLSATIYLILRGHRRVAALAGAATLIPLGLFTGFLCSTGLGPLPGSVLLKAPVFAPGFFESGSVANLRTTLRDPTGVLLALAALWMIGIALSTTRSVTDRTLASASVIAIALHAIAGRYGAYHRWELYIVCFTLLTLLYLERSALEPALTGRSVSLTGAIAAMWCVVLGARYIFGLSTVPIAANNIHEQQYQLHRYANEFERRPVAINDLGYVSFRNRHFVLDLLGLASPELLSHVSARSRLEWLKSELPRRGIETAMIYDEWFEGTPQALGWRRVGVLHLSRAKITSAWERVVFYATTERAYPGVRSRVGAFAADLPSRIRLELER